MKKPLLDLYITHWTEPWEIGRPGLEILKLQRCVDWSLIRVTIVHDGSEAFPAEYFEGYPMEIRQECLPHGGIAKARNWCIDHGEAEWIKWNDFDDMFAGIYSVKNIMNALQPRGGGSPDFEMLWFDVYAEEIPEGGRIPGVHLKDQRDPVVVHGKIFNRKFLLDHKLRFPEDLTWCEDSAFLAVMEMEINHQKIGKIQCEAPIYAWICRNGSLCNRPEIKFDNLKSFFRRHCYVQEEFKRRGLMDPYYTMTARVLADSYFTLELADVKEDTSEHRKRVRDYYMEHRGELAKIRPEMMDGVITAVNRENKGSNFTKAEFLGWLRSMNEG